MKHEDLGPWPIYSGLFHNVDQVLKEDLYFRLRMQVPTTLCWTGSKRSRIVARIECCRHRVADRMEQQSRCRADAPVQRMAPLAMDWGRQLRLRYVPHQSWILSNRFLAPGDDAGSLEAIRNRNFVEGGRSGLHSGPDHHLSLPSDPRGSLVGDVVHEMLLEAPIHSSVQRLQNM